MERNTWTGYKSKVEKEDPELIKRMERNTKYSLRMERAISNRDCKGNSEDIPSILQDFEDEIRQENAQSNKETAEKIFRRVFEEFNIFNDKEKILIYQVRDILKYVAKQSGVEIKE